MATAGNALNQLTRPSGCRMNISESAIKQIFTLAKGLEFGEVIIKIQDSHIVLIERHERIRLKKQADSANSGEATFNG